MLNQLQILDRLRQAFIDAWIALDPTISFDRELRFDEVDGLDSVSRVRLMMIVEDAFSVKFSAREASKAVKIGDLVDLIESKLKNPLKR